MPEQRDLSAVIAVVPPSVPSPYFFREFVTRHCSQAPECRGEWNYSGEAVGFTQKGVGARPSAPKNSLTGRV